MRQRRCCRAGRGKWGDIEQILLEAQHRWLRPA
ncbi:Calmodulin-binding transcription activator 2 -like protein [Gossypium arboreum]|uniref:Calmodulin-binding transcription activator 2-like protein n=1 Tax=Gossypium arboreum TaxID=29729 RepID=A0A0B0NGA2_GOSAR|nr:Calmodulin-binding transcription activator 2 -like protein [Gossypium arboreum]